MILKRNLFTVIYSFLFIIFMFIGFAGTLYMTLNASDNPIVAACFLLVGIMIYLIAALFIKEKKALAVMQDSSTLNILLEGIMVAGTVGGIAFLNSSKGFESVILIGWMLLSIYFITRILLGRLCGIAGLVLGFVYLAYVSGYPFNLDEYIHVLCFLAPYLFFLIVTRVVTNVLAENKFILFSSYVILAIIFSFSLIIEPFVIVLLLGCVFSLIFGDVPGRKGLMYSGPAMAGLLLLFTILFSIAGYFVIPDVPAFYEPTADAALFSFPSIEDTVQYLLEKYKEAGVLLYQPFSNGVFPTLLLFMAALAGYFCIRKKDSAIGPLCFSFLVLIAYHGMYEAMGTPCYYISYFVLIFAAYGLTNTLIPEELPEKAVLEKHAETDPEQKTEIKETESLTEVEETEKTEKAEKTIKTVDSKEEVFNPLEEEEEKVVDNKLEGIPEWTVSASYLQKMAGNNSEPVVVSEQQELQLDEELLVEEPLNEVQQEERQEEIQVEVQAKIPSEDVYPTDVELTAEHAAEEKSEELQPMEEPLEEDFSELSKDDTDSSFGELTTGAASDSMDSELNTLSADPAEEEAQLNNLLNRLDISENIRRMNESAQEDIADVIEREDEHLELSSAIPTDALEEKNDEEFFFEEAQEKQEDGIYFEELPKYEKPDFQLEPSEQFQSAAGSEISEYDTVPTINDLERKWRKIQEQESKQNGFAYSLEDVVPASAAAEKQEPNYRIARDEEESGETSSVHYEEIVKKSGVGKRAYQKLTLS